MENNVESFIDGDVSDLDFANYSCGIYSGGVCGDLGYDGGVVRLEEIRHEINQQRSA